MSSLEEYVLVSQDQPRIEVFRRLVDGSWNFDAFSGIETVALLKSISIELPLSEAYAGVEFVAEKNPALGESRQES